MGQIGGAQETYGDGEHRADDGGENPDEQRLEEGNPEFLVALQAGREHVLPQLPEVRQAFD